MGAPSNRTATLESQMIPMIQDVPGQTLRRRPEILSYVAAKFSWILVDEFQDTTDLQVEILALIAGADSARFLLVGDPHQSIFRFAGARPDLAVDFAKRISDQCDINVGLVIEASIPRVVPPRINSRSRECPYPPMTMRSAYVSAAYDRIAFETSILLTGMRSVVTFTP